MHTTQETVLTILGLDVVSKVHRERIWHAISGFVLGGTIITMAGLPLWIAVTLPDVGFLDAPPINAMVMLVIGCVPIIYGHYQLRRWWRLRHTLRELPPAARGYALDSARLHLADLTETVRLRAGE